MHVDFDVFFFGPESDIRLDSEGQLNISWFLLNQIKFPSLLLHETQSRCITNSTQHSLLHARKDAKQVYEAQLTGDIRI